jgi:AcrR family transcriptional regulator
MPTSQPGRRRKETSPHAIQLPSGRHGLPREFVAGMQFERLAYAVEVSVAEHGYRAATVDRIAATAGVSRRTFYEHFNDKHDAYLTSFGIAAAALMAHINRAVENGTTDFASRSHQCLSVLLNTLAARPQAAHAYLVDVNDAPDPASACRDAQFRQLATIFLKLDEADGGDLSPALAASLATAIQDVIITRVAAGQYEQLPALVDDIHSMLLTLVGRASSGAAVEPVREVVVESERT